MEVFTLIIEFATAVIGAIGHFVGKKRQHIPNITVENIIIVNQTLSSSNREKARIQSATRNQQSTSPVAILMAAIVGTMMVLAFGIYLYANYHTALEAIISCLSFLLCVVSIMLHWKFKLSAKEEARAARILAQPLVFHCASLFCIWYFDLTELFSVFRASSWSVVLAEYAKNLRNESYIIFGWLCLATIAFYFLQALVLLLMMAHFFMLFVRYRPNTCLMKVVSSLAVFAPSAASATLIIVIFVYVVKSLA